MNKILIPLKFILSHPLAKAKPISAIFRFLNWQIKSRWHKNSIDVNWIGTLKLSMLKGMHGATGCIYVGLPEFEDMSFLLHFLTPNSYFIDVGANVGVYSLLAAGITNCNTISIEPIPQTFNYFKKNITLNHLEQKISGLNIGLSNQKGSLHFTTDKDTVNHVVENKTTNAITVQVDTLDNILPKNITQNTLMKLDVEGFEYKVLKGAKNLLLNNNLKAIIVELNGSGTKFGLSDAMVDEILVANNFVKYDYNPFSRKLNKITSFHTEGNTLYLRDSAIETIKNKLLSASSFTIFNQTI